MPPLTLLFGDKNHCSCSQRYWPWLRHLDLPFEQVQILPDTPDFAAKLTQMGVLPGLPVAKTSALVIRDSPAICEYASELT